MRRRDFIKVVAGSAITWPPAARGEQPSGARRIGVLMSFAEDDTLSKEALAGFQQGLESFGWSEGRNLRIEYRFAAGKADRFQALAKELVATKPDIILAQGTASTAALQQHVVPRGAAGGVVSPSDTPNVTSLDFPLSFDAETDHVPTSVPTAILYLSWFELIRTGTLFG